MPPPRVLNSSPVRPTHTPTEVDDAQSCASIVRRGIHRAERYHRYDAGSPFEPRSPTPSLPDSPPPPHRSLTTRSPSPVSLALPAQDSPRRWSRTCDAYAIWTPSPPPSSTASRGRLRRGSRRRDRARAIRRASEPGRRATHPPAAPPRRPRTSARSATRAPTRSHSRTRRWRSRRLRTTSSTRTSPGSIAI